MESGANTAVICNATVAGNSTVILQWNSSGRTLRELTIEDTLSAANLTQDTVNFLCSGISGVFSLPLQSFLAPNLFLNLEGAIFLHLRTALLICDASPSLSNAYSCFATNTSRSAGEEYKVTFSLHVSSNIRYYVLVVASIILLLTIVMITTIIVICVIRYNRSVKEVPLPMTPQSQLPLSPHGMHSFTNPLFLYPEFSRDKLHLLGVLGESSLA